MRKYFYAVESRCVAKAHASQSCKDWVYVGLSYTHKAVKLLLAECKKPPEGWRSGHEFEYRVLKYKFEKVVSS